MNNKSKFSYIEGNSRAFWLGEINIVCRIYRKLTINPLFFFASYIEKEDKHESRKFSNLMGRLGTDCFFVK